MSPLKASLMIIVVTLERLIPWLRTSCLERVVASALNNGKISVRSVCEADVLSSIVLTGQALR